MICICILRELHICKQVQSELTSQNFNFLAALPTKKGTWSTYKKPKKKSNITSFILKFYTLLSYYFIPPIVFLMLLLDYDPTYHVIEAVLKNNPTLQLIFLQFTLGSRILQILAIFAFRYFINFCIFYESARITISFAVFGVYTEEIGVTVIALMKTLFKKSPSKHAHSLIKYYKKLWIVYQHARNLIQVSFLLGLVLILVLSVGSNVVVLQFREYISPPVLFGLGAFSISVILATKLLFDMAGYWGEECDLLVIKLKGFIHDRDQYVEERAILKKEICSLPGLSFPVGFWNYEFFQMKVSNATETLRFILDQTFSVVIEIKSSM